MYGHKKQTKLSVKMFFFFLAVNVCCFVVVVDKGAYAGTVTPATFQFYV